MSDESKPAAPAGKPQAPRGRPRPDHLTVRPFAGLRDALAAQEAEAARERAAAFARVHQAGQR